jgi:nitroreductase
VCIPGNSPANANESIDIVNDSDLRKYSRTASKEEDYSTILKAYEESKGNITPSSKDHLLREIDLKAQGNQVFSQDRLGSVMTYAESVFKRRSLRNYVHGEMASNAVGGLLNLISADADSFEHSLDETLVCGFLAGKGSGIEPGFYLVNRKERTFGHVCHGDFVSPMTRICLEQDWLANCSLHFVFISDLKAVQENFGSRGYRYAMISAGRMGQRLYVACTSIKQGACGIGAFYDSEAADLLGLGESGRMLYLVGAGPVRKWTW